MTDTAFAFFDVDDTLLAVKSMFDFYRHLCLDEWRDPQRLLDFEEEFRRLRAAGTEREALNSHYYTHFKGLTARELVILAERWWLSLNVLRPALFFPETVERLRAHRRDGVTPVFVSGSCAALLAPVGRALGVEHFLAAPLLADAEGRFTGALGTPQTIGEGKRHAAEAFLAERGADPAASFAYGDDLSDAPLLSAVGHPVAVGRGTPLTALAAERGWAVLPIGDPAPLALPAAA